MSCSSHRNWVQSFDETLSTSEMPENIDDDLVSFRDFIQRHKNHNKKAG
jgi:hypothetical protein